MKDNIDPFQFIVFGVQKDGDSEVKYNVLGPDGVVYEGGTLHTAHSMASLLRGGYIQHKQRDLCAFYLEAISRGVMHDDKVLALMPSVLADAAHRRILSKRRASALASKAKA